MDESAESVPSESLTTEDRLSRIEQLLEMLSSTDAEKESGNRDMRTEAIYAEVDRIRETISARRARGKVISQQIWNNLARFDVLVGGRF